MGKVIALVAVAGLLAGGGTYALVHHSCPLGLDTVDPADCPVVKVGGCSHCSGGALAASPESEPDACCADTGAVARESDGKASAAVAVAGPAALFGSAKKKACCCCEAEPTNGLAAVVGVAAIAAK